MCYSVHWVSGPAGLLFSLNFKHRAESVDLVAQDIVAVPENYPGITDGYFTFTLWLTVVMQAVSLLLKKIKRIKKKFLVNYDRLLIN